MGAVDTPQPRAGKKKGPGFSRPKRRVGIRIDMTPMVDVAFLLLIFFMVTTVFRTPQALEINLPPDEKVEIQVKESNVLQLRVLDEERAYWKKGSKEIPWARTSVAGLENVFKSFRNDTALVVTIKIDREAKFANMVNVIDGLDMSRLTRFSLDKLSDEDKQEVSSL
ncbi:MAG TPA: biopolymer transporter ExbD [Candidatus Limnocylindria bacterium]|nr:biopolymer transporter ExbD [Candidatus Limnocylindria bacterium]